MSGPVTAVRRWCNRCGGSEIEVAHEAKIANWLLHERRAARCLRCMATYSSYWWPGEFERACQSARYLAA